MNPTDYLISCDWGTSNFRAHLVNAANGVILDTVDSGKGIKTLFLEWEEAGRPERLLYFVNHLEERIYPLMARAEPKPGRVTVYISGMASSTIGLRELPYSELPFSLTGNDLVTEKLAVDLKDVSIFLFSGLRSPHDVMRGEESQLLGLAEYFKQEEGIAILPGTHSKHVYLQAGLITGFQTFMTGEYFALLSQNSILKNSISPSIPAVTEWDYFERGVNTARQTNVLAASFRVRTNDLLHRVSPAENYYYLSGLLIGSELSGLSKDIPIYLCGGGRLQPPYRRALEVLGYEKVTVLQAEVVDLATVNAHLAFHRKKHFLS